MNKSRLIFVTVFLLGFSGAAQSALITRVINESLSTFFPAPNTGLNLLANPAFVVGNSSSDFSSRIDNIVFFGNTITNLASGDGNNDTSGWHTAGTTVDNSLTYMQTLQLGVRNGSGTTTSIAGTNTTLFAGLKKNVIGLSAGAKFGYLQIDFGATLDDTIVVGYAFEDSGGSIVTANLAPAVPLPPAFFLFGSGILGLIGMARRSRASQ